MRRDLVLAALLLPLGGCYLPPSGASDYAQPGYPQAGYSQPGYPPAGYEAYGNVYPGYSDNGGNPTFLVEGAPMPLILYGGSWGYWDSHHSWHRAPDAVSHHLEERRASGEGFRHGGEDFARPRFEGHPPAAGEPNRGRGFFHANEQARPVAVPGPRARPEGPAHEEHPHGHGCPPGQRC